MLRHLADDTKLKISLKLFVFFKFFLIDQSVSPDSIKVCKNQETCSPDSIKVCKNQETCSTTDKPLKTFKF